MYRVIKVPFRANKNVIDRLFECNRISADVWNDCLDIAKNHALSNHGKWITKTALQTATKGKYHFHSQNVQNVVHKYIEARDGAFQARQKGYTNKYPYKKKKNFNTTWVDKAFHLTKDGTLTLSLGNGKKGCKRPKPIVVRLPKERLKHCFDKNDACTVAEIELIFDRQLHFCLTYNDGKEEPKQLKTNETAAIDPGEIHTISASSTANQGIIITGRKIRSIHRLRNKKLKELQKRMSKCKKGSRKLKKYNRAKQCVLSKSDRQLKDALHKTTKNFIDWCVSNDIDEVVVGDVEGVQRNTRKNKKKRRHRKTNQKLSNWSFGKIYEYLAYKGKAQGIAFSTIDESYTSQTCPVCGNRRKSTSRNYKCSKCAYKKHRDMHGACNILSKYLYGRFRPVNIDHTTYLQPI